MSNQKPTPRGIAARMRLAMGRQVSTAIQLIDEKIPLEKVDSLTQLIRIKTCEGCDRFDPDTRQCLECTCPMDYKTSLLRDPTKVLVGEKDNKTRCPLRKW